MTKKNLKERIKQYATYFEQEIARHMANVEFESLHGAIAEEGKAITLKLARDRLYEIFPDIKPAGYKTVTELDKERDAQLRSKFY